MLEALQRLGWIGLVDRPRGGPRRWAQLVDPQSLTLMPLVDALLLDQAASIREGFVPQSLVPEQAINQPLQVVLDSGPP